MLQTFLDLSNKKKMNVPDPAIIIFSLDKITPLFSPQVQCLATFLDKVPKVPSVKHVLILFGTNVLDFFTVYKKSILFPNYTYHFSFFNNILN